MSKTKFAAIFGGGLLAGALGAAAVQEAAGGVEPEDAPESADYWRGYDEGYTDALDTMAYSRPPRRRPTKKRRRKDRQAVPERRQGA